MAELTTKQITGLDAASARIAAGTPGAATDNNAGDVANVDYATANLGYSFNQQPSSDLSLEQAPTNLQVDQGQESLVGQLTTDQQQAFVPDNAVLENQMNQFEQTRQSYNQQLQVLNTQKLADAQEKQLGLEGEIRDVAETDLLAQKRTLFEEQNIQGRLDDIDEIATELQDLYTGYFQKDASIKNSPNLTTAAGRGLRQNAEDDFKSKAAGLEIRKNILGENYTRAKNVALEYYDSFIQTNENRKVAYNTLLSLARDNVITLDDREQSQIAENKQLLDDVNNRVLAERDASVDLMTKYPTAWAKAGIDMANDSYATIVSKLSPVIAEASNVENLSLQYPDAGITENDTIQSATRKMKNDSLVYRKEVNEGLIDTGDGLAQYDPTSNTISYPTTGTRTDRNYNPIAISNAIPQWLETLDAAGIKYTLEQGKDFGSGLKTINFGNAENGMEAAKLLLGKTITDSSGADKSPFYWYKNHTGEAILNEYNLENPEQFNALPDILKESIVKDIYSNEQPNGLLYDRISSGDDVRADSDELTTAELKAFDLPAGSTWGEAKSLSITPGQITDAEAQNTISGIEGGLDSMLKQLTVIPENLKGTLQGRIAKWTAVKERNELVAGFETQRAIVGMMLTRLFEKGRISDADRLFYMEQMPNMNQTAEAASASARQLMEQLKQRVITQEELSVINGISDSTVNVSDNTYTSTSGNNYILPN